MMKAFAAALVALCFCIATVDMVEGQSTGVIWNDDGPPDNFESFSSPGVILPNLAVGDIITIAGKVWNADDLLESIGFLCRDLGPAINQITGGIVRRVCDPVLLALQDASQRNTYRLCNETWSLIEGLFGGQLDYGPNNTYPDGPYPSSPSIRYPPGYYALQSFVNHLIGLSYWLDSWTSCNALGRLYYNTYFNGSQNDNIFDKLVTIGIYSVYSEAESRCSYGEYYDQFQNDVIGSLFRILGDYGSTSELCDNLYPSDTSLVDTVKENFYAAVTNLEECMWVLSEFQSDTGVSPSNYSTFETDSDLCNAVITSFTIGSFEYESGSWQHNQGNDTSSTTGPDSESGSGQHNQTNVTPATTTNPNGNRGWFSRVIHHFGGVYIAHNDTNQALEILCLLLESTNKDFCSTIKTNSYPSFDDYCQNDYYEGRPYIPNGYWAIKPLVNDLLDSEYRVDEDGVCYALQNLFYGYSNYYNYYHHYSNSRDVFDELLSVLIFDTILSAEELCIHNHYAQSGNATYYFDYDVNAIEHQILNSVFQFLGDYPDINEFCDGIDFPDSYYSYDTRGHNDRLIISTTLKNNFYSLVTNVPVCMTFMDRFENDTGLSASNFSSFANNDEFCIALVNTFTGVDTHIVTDDEDFGGRLLNLSGEIYRHRNSTRSLVKLLCFAADGTDKEFCQNLNMTGYTHFGDRCTAREEYYPNYPSEYSLGAFLRKVVYGQYPNGDESCRVLGELYHSDHTNVTDSFDHLLTAFINNSAFWFFHNYCHPYEYYYGNLEKMIDTSLMFFSDNALSLTSVADICNITKLAYNSPNSADLAQFVNTIKGNLYNAMSSDTTCENAIGALQTNLNVSFVQSTDFNSISDICHSGLVPLFNGNQDTADQPSMMMNTSLSSLNEYDYEWLRHLINVTAAVRRMNDIDYTVQTLCNFAYGTSKRFCRSIGQQNFSGDFGYQCRFYYEPSDPNIYEIYSKVGGFVLRTLDFDFQTHYDYIEACDALEHVLKIRQDEQTFPDFILTSVIRHMTKYFGDECQWGDYFYEQPFASLMTFLAGFGDVIDFCNASSTARYNHEYFNDIVQQVKESVYLATANQSSCLDSMTRLQASANLGASNISTSLDNAELCTALVQAFNHDHDADMSDENTYMNDSENILSQVRFFGRLLRLQNQINITRYLCYASDSIYNKGLCDGLERYISDFSYECSNGCPSCYDHATTSYPSYPYYSNYSSPGYYVPNPFYSSDYWSLNPLVSSLIYQTWLGNYETCNAFSQIFYSNYYDYSSSGKDSFERLLSVFMYDSIKYANWSCSPRLSESITLTRIHSAIVRLLGKFPNNDDMCNYTRHAVSADHGAPLVFLADSMKANLLHAVTNVSACEDFFESFTSLTTLDVNSYTSFATIPQLCSNLTQIIGPSFDPAEARMKLLQYSNNIDSLTTKEWFHSRALMMTTLFSFGNDTASVVETLCHLSPGLDNNICHNISLNWNIGYQYYYSYYFYGYCNYGLNGYSSQISPRAADLHICYRGDFINFNAVSNFNFTGFLLELASSLYGLSTFDRKGVCTSVSTVIDSGINLPSLITEFGREWLELFLPVGAEICECWESFIATLFHPGQRYGAFGAQELRQIVDFVSRTLNFPNFQAFCDDLTSSLNDDQSIRQYADRLINMSFGIIEDPDQCICLANEGIRMGLSFANISYNVFHNQYFYAYTGFRTIDELCYKLTGAIRGREVTEEEQIQSQLNQACGVCGSETTGCFTIRPTLIPAGTENELVLRGIDFQPQQGSQCVIQGDSGSVNSDVLTDQMGRHYCTVNLEPGSYQVYLSSGGDQSATYSDLYVYPDIQLDAIFPAEVDLPFFSSSIEFKLISHNGNFSSIREAGFTPQAIVIDEGTGRVVNDEANVMSHFHEYNTSIVILETIVPSESGAYRVALSLNGIDPLPTPDERGLLVRFYVEDPKPVNLRFTNQGNGLRLEFDRFIRVDETTSCDAIFTNTSALGTDSRCFTRPRSNILLIKIGQGDDLIGIGNSLTLKQNDTIGVFREAYTRPQMGHTLYVQQPNTSVTVQARLEGNEVINLCSFVSIRATKSTGSAGRPLSFKWSGGPDHADLQQIFDDAGSRLSFNGSYLSSAVTYEFRCNITNFLGGFDSATYQVTREETVAPEVSIVAQRVNIDEPIKVSQPFELVARVAFSEQCGGAGDVSFMWSTTVPGVTFNPNFANKRNLFIGAGTMPGDMDIPITVTVAKVDDPSQMTSRTMTVTTVSSDPVAKIKGSGFHTIGISSGILEIDGSRSYDPEGQNDLLLYTWTCMNLVTQGLCLSADDSDILPSDQANTSLISFNANRMVPESIYVITLEVTKNSRSDTDTSYIQAKPGTPPQIIPGEVEPRVRRDKYFYVSAIITHVGDITVVWETTDEGDGFIDMTDLYTTQPFAPGYSLTTFILDRGILEEGISYTFQVTATDTQNQVAVSSVSTRVYAGVSSCTFSLLGGTTTYTELEEIIFVVENCVTDEDALPLSYQLFLERRARFRALGDAVFEGSFETLGRAPPAEGTINHFVAKVCNTFGSCQVFSLYLTVTEKPSFSLEEFQAIKDNQVEEAKNSGNFDNALSIFLAVLETFQRQDTNGRRKRAVATVPDQTEENAAELLGLIQSAMESSVLTTASAQTRIDQSDALTVTDLTLTDIGVLLGIYEDLLEVFFNDEELLPTDSADVINGKLDDIIGVLTLPDDLTLHSRVRKLSHSVSNSRLLGAPPGETTDTMSEYYHQRAVNTIPQGTYSSTSNDSTSIEVDFGSDIETRFGPSWDCGNIDSCSGVNIIFTQYHDNVDFLTDPFNDTRASAILDIKLYKPSSDEILTVSGLTAPISINLTATLPQAGKVYDCYFWDTALSLWSIVGVTTIRHSDTESQCLADHLTSFALFGVDPPPTTSGGISPTTGATSPTYTTTIDGPGPAPGLSLTIIIVIAVVAVLLVVITIVIVAFVCIKSKKTTENKVRDSTPPPNRPGDMAMRP